MDAVNIEEALPLQHEARLPHSRQKLLANDGRRQVRKTQVGSANRDCAGRADDDIAAFTMQLGKLAYELYQARTIQEARAAGEYACSELNDDTFVHNFAAGAYAQWLLIPWSRRRVARATVASPIIMELLCGMKRKGIVHKRLLLRLLTMANCLDGTVETDHNDCLRRVSLRMYPLNPKQSIQIAC